VAKLAKETKIFLNKDKIWIDGEDVSDEIRKATVTQNVEKMA
jgi:cytidylate kinase